MKRLTTILLLVLAAVPVLAQDVSRQKERKKQIEQEIALIDKQLDANTSKRKESLNTLILTRQKLNARKKLITQLDSDIAGYNRDKRPDRPSECQTGHAQEIPRGPGARSLQDPGQ